MLYPVSSRKSVSKLLAIWTFILFLILKGAFAKPAIALSTVDTCVTQPACGAAISSEVAPAVTAPTGAGWGASTLSTTTATGTTSTYVKAVASFAVVTAGVLTPESTANDANIARWHYWSQATNSRAQVLAKQRYCAAYPTDSVCTPFKGGQGDAVMYHVRTTYSYYVIPRGVTVVNSIRNEYWGPVTAVNAAFRVADDKVYLDITTTSRGRTAQFNRVPPTSNTPQPLTETFLVVYPASNFSNLKILGYSVEREYGQPDTSGNPPPLPWEQWPQEKRNLAVDLLTDSDWQSLISSMPEGGRLNPGEQLNAPKIVIPGEETDDPITPQDERLTRKVSSPFSIPPAPDSDSDGTPDSSDPEPQNPNVPRASSDPPPPSNEPAPSEGEQEVDQVRENYDDFLDRPENAGFRDCLDEIEEKYRRAAQMEAEDPNSQEAGWLAMEAEDELAQLRNEIGEAWWSSLSQYEQQLFDGRSQAEINEMQRLMEQWDQGTFDDVAHSIVHHAPKKGYEDSLEYMRDASRFDKSQAERIPPQDFRNDGTVRWEIRSSREFLVEDQYGKIRTYGFNEY